MSSEIQELSDLIKNDIVAFVVEEQEFCIHDNIHVWVNIYQEHGRYKMTSWLNHIEELNTIDITDKYKPGMDKAEIIAMMEALIYDNEEYIVSVANWDDED